MNSEDRAKKVEEIDQWILELTVKLLQESQLDVAKLKVVHAVREAEEKLKLLARKLEGAEDERDFSPEETVEGIRAMLGKGDDK
jgi:hypothetical protein